MAYTLYTHNTPRIRGVLFDMDGLVLDTERLYTRFWMEASRCCGFSMTLEQALGMRSLGAKDGASRILSYFGPDADYQRIRAKRIELMDAFIEKEGVIPKPGIRELLRYLKEHGIKTAIATSSPIARAQAHLGSLGLAEQFDAICSSHDVAHPKPAPDIYIHAAATLGLKPEECLALEDSPAGILSAYRAGCFPAMIPDLDQPDEEILQILFAKADSLTDIIDLLEIIKL